MSMKRISGLLGLTALALVAGTAATAQEPAWYLGANIGTSKTKIDDVRITSGLLDGGLTTTSISDRDSSTGGKLFVGYKFGPYFAIEGGYFDLGKFGYTAATLPLGTLTGDLRYKGFNLDALVSLPFTEKFSAFGRVGVARGQASDTFTSTGAVVILTPNPTQNSTNVKFGAGLEYDFTRHFGLRAELERYRLDDAVHNKGDVDLASVGLVIRFGRHHAAAEPVVMRAEPVETRLPVAAVEPAVIVAAKTQVYCSVLDLQFDIDKDDIQGDDLENLKVLGTFMTKYPETTAVIEGHTDNVGSDEHNNILSKHRAESVVNYLVDTLHIDRNRLSSKGYGNTRPVGDNATDEGKRQNRRIDAIIACATDIEGLQVMPARVTMGMLIEYDANKSDIKAEYEPELRKVGNFLKAHPKVHATVEGHTGNLQMTQEKAVVISMERADKVVAFLVDKCGIDRARLSAEAYGRSRQTAYNSAPDGPQENRRVNIIFNYPKN